MEARLEEWGRNRQGRAAIPDKSWSAGTEVARKDGVSRTASSAPGLRQAQTADDGGDGVEKRTATPSFMELIAPEAAAVSRCTIELEGRRGIRIELKANAADVASFSRTLAQLVL